MLTGAGALIICQNKIVLGLDWTATFADFGGKCDKNDSLLKTASKELFEETSMLFSITPEKLSEKTFIDLDRYRCYLIKTNCNAENIIKEFIINKDIIDKRENEWNEVSILVAYEYKYLKIIPLRTRTKKILYQLSEKLLESLSLTHGIKTIDESTGITTYYFK